MEKDIKKEQAKAELSQIISNALENDKQASAESPVEETGETASIEEVVPKKQKIDEKAIDKAMEILRKYKDERTALENRVIDNEEWWKIHNLRTDSKGNIYDKERSAWLFNSVSNKHADAMDNAPTCNILPREQDDVNAADALSEIIPCVLERNQFDRTYSDVWYDKLISGTGIYGVFWNPTKDNLGDVEIVRQDILTLFWEAGIEDIQDSSNVFSVKLWNNDQLISVYPEVADKVGQGIFETSKYIYDDNIDTTAKTPVIDWYYKVTGPNGDPILHYCKFCNGVVLYASENDPEYADVGWYQHNMYPFVFDKLYSMHGTPVGFSLVDIMKDAQDSIDKMSTSIVENAKIATKRRFFVNSAGAINEEEYANYNNTFIHFTGSGNPNESIMPDEVPLLHQNYLSILEQKINELKETSGNNDWSQGGTTSGVTAASAIAALQEAGSKLSRDMIKQSYRAYERVCNMVIWMIRQFYDTPRTFRILGQGQMQQFIEFDNQQIGPQPLYANGEVFAERMPIYDIKVKAQKESPFSRLSQNELAIQFYQLGVFNPANADMVMPMIEMLEFEGKDTILHAIQKNAQLPMLQQYCVQFAMELSKYDPKYANIAEGFIQKFGMDQQALSNPNASPDNPATDTTVNSLGETNKVGAGNYMATKAADKAAEMAAVK